MGEASFRERYPPPWQVEAIPGGFRVMSSNGFPLAYIYATDGIARTANPNSLLHREALSLARAIAGLPRDVGE